jgi:hypothetical protein
MQLQRNFVPKKGAHRLDHRAGPRLAPVDQALSRRRTSGDKGAGLLTAAACLLLLLAAAQGYVSFRAQYTFIDHTKHTHIPSIMEALGLDTGAVIFALLALSLARRGQPATIERVLNVACALGSMTMNLLAANLTSPRSITVWVMPSVLYAFASDRLIAVVRRWVRAHESDTQLVHQGSPWRSLGGLLLWLMRLIFDPLGTVTGFRRWVLVIAPLAPSPQTTGLIASRPTALSAGDDGGQPIPGETKREALIRLYEKRGEAGDPRYGNPAKAAQVAGEIAGEIGYHAGTARRELAKYLAARPVTAGGAEQTTGRPGLHPVKDTDSEAVA